MHVEPFTAIKSAACTSLTATIAALGFVQEFGRVRADVAEALNGHAGLLAALRPRRLSSLSDENSDAAAGGFFAPRQSVELDRLAGHAGRAEAVVLVVLVHDPGHHFGIGAHVGGRNVDVGADHVVNAVDELARDALQFAVAEACADRWRCPPWRRRRED